MSRLNISYPLPLPTHIWRLVSTRSADAETAIASLDIEPVTTRIRRDSRGDEKDTYTHIKHKLISENDKKIKLRKTGDKK